MVSLDSPYNIESWCISKLSVHARWSSEASTDCAPTAQSGPHTKEPVRGEPSLGSWSWWSASILLVAPWDPALSLQISIERSQGRESEDWHSCLGSPHPHHLLCQVQCVHLCVLAIHPHVSSRLPARVHSCVCMWVCVCTYMCASHTPVSEGPALFWHQDCYTLDDDPGWCSCW